MDASNSTIRCLLCAAALTEQNKTHEHAILRAIGGRIESDRITCSACNNATGSKIDKYLADAYFAVVGVLREFLPADSDVIGKGVGTAILRIGEKDFRTKMPLDPVRCAKGNYIATGPEGEKSVATMSQRKLGSAYAQAVKIGHAKYGDGKYRIEAVGPGPPPFLARCGDHLPGSIGVQCSALKAGILTLAALGAETHGIDLRSPGFDCIRQTIKAVNDTPASDGTQVQVPILPKAKHGVCLGLHQQLLPQLTNLRRFSSFPATDFEHFIVLSGNAATQTLELFVVLFAAHVFAFRLTNDWQKGDIVLLAVNGILKNSGHSKLERLRANPLPVHARSVPKSGADPAQRTPALELLARANAYQFRHSKQVREIIRNSVRIFGTLNEAVRKLIEGLNLREAEKELIQNKCAKFAAEATDTRGSAPTDDQIDQAANDIAQLIDERADRGIFPSRYD